MLSSLLWRSNLMNNTNQLIYQASVQSIFYTLQTAVIIYFKIMWISGEDPQGNQAKKKKVRNDTGAPMDFGKKILN